MSTILETRDLVKQFGGLTATDHVNLSLEEGELMSLIGPNGAGKSTLINLITRKLQETSGDILFEGDSIVGLEPHEVVQRGRQIVPDGFDLPGTHCGGEREHRVVRRRTRRLPVQLPATPGQLPRSRRADPRRARRGRVAPQKDVTATDLPYGDKRRLEIGIAPRASRRSS